MNIANTELIPIVVEIAAVAFRVHDSLVEMNFKNEIYEYDERDLSSLSLLIVDVDRNKKKNLRRLLDNWNLKTVDGWRDSTSTTDWTLNWVWFEQRPVTHTHAGKIKIRRTLLTVWLRPVLWYSNSLSRMAIATETCFGVIGRKNTALRANNKIKRKSPRVCIFHICFVSLVLHSGGNLSCRLAGSMVWSESG